MFGALAFEKVGRYLALLGKKLDIDKEKGIIKVHEKVDNEETVVEIRFTRNWVITYVKLGSIKELPNDTKIKVLEKLLLLNRNYAEVCFGIDEEYNVYCEEDTLVDALTLDVFLEEYNAVLIAFELWEKEIMPIIKKS